MRSRETAKAVKRGTEILEARGMLPREPRENRTAIAAGAISDLLTAIGPADAVEALRRGVDFYLSPLCTGSGQDAPTRRTLEAVRCALRGQVLA